MQVLEKYQSLGTHLASDRKIQKYTVMLVKHGVKGAAKKVNPATIYLDAALSVCEAISSYLSYARECEITRQLEIENQTLKARLQADLDIINTQFNTAFKAGQARINEIERALKHTQSQIKDLNWKVTELLSTIKGWQAFVRVEREENGSFEQLMRLQNELDCGIKQCLFLIQQSLYAESNRSRRESVASATARC